MGAKTMITSENHPEFNPDIMVAVNENGLNNSEQLRLTVDEPPGEVSRPCRLQRSTSMPDQSQKPKEVAGKDSCWPAAVELKATLKIYFWRILFFISLFAAGWIGYDRRCYYFSDEEGTWDAGQGNCSLHGASLAVIDTPQEMNFLLRCKYASDYWFGLRRKDEEQPWKWTNGSNFSGWFSIGANGPCAYLNDKAASSTWCDTERNWICSKLDHTT